MSDFTTLGPGSYTLKKKGSTDAAVDFSGEALNFSIQHAQKDSGESRTMWNSDVRSAKTVRDFDAVTIEHEYDLHTTGLYALLQVDHGEVYELTMTPKTGGAYWTGDIYLSLPESLGAEEYGAVVKGPVTWKAVSTFEFLPIPGSV